MSEAHKATQLPRVMGRKRWGHAWLSRRLFGVVTYGKAVTSMPGSETERQPVGRRSPRQGGSLRGRIWMADNFDELPPNVLGAMLGDED